MKNKILTGLCILLIFIALPIQVRAESFRANKTNVTVGDTFSVTISGINGKVTVSSNDKVSLSSQGTMFVDGSTTITGTAKSVGTGTVSVKLIDVTTSGANPKELTGTKTINITVKEKETPKQETSSSTKKSETTTTTQKKTTTTKNNTVKKENTPIVPMEEKEDATPEWGIYAVKLTGIKENEERVEIELNQPFDLHTYEYSCNVAFDVKKIEVEKDALEYNDFVTITGIEEDLKPGENIITLKLAKEGQEELTYTIKIMKEENEESATKESTLSEEELPKEEIEKSKPIIVSIPLWSFLLLEVGIVILTSAVTVHVMKKMRKTSRR